MRQVGNQDFSSNLTIDGCLLDFGAARALPDWSYAQTLDHALGFGREMIIVDQLIESLAFHFRKYAALEAPMSAAALRAEAAMAYEAALQRECLGLWGLQSNGDAALIYGVVEPLRGYFRAQQHVQNNYRHLDIRRQGWLFDSLDERQKYYPSDSLERTLLRKIDVALTMHFGQSEQGAVRRQQAWARAKISLRPRELLYREPLQDRIEHALFKQASQADVCREAVRELICETVERSLHHRPHDNPRHADYLRTSNLHGATH